MECAASFFTKITYVLLFIPYVHIIGIFKIKNTIKTCGGIPIILALDLFDKIVLPILIYGAEIWGTKYAGPIEVVHIKYCEYILRVSSSTSNTAVMCELGRHPLYIHYFCRCVKFWFNIIHNNASAPRLRTSITW